MEFVPSPEQRTWEIGILPVTVTFCDFMVKYILGSIVSHLHPDTEDNQIFVGSSEFQIRINTLNAHSAGAIWAFVNDLIRARWKCWKYWSYDFMKQMKQ